MSSGMSPGNAALVVAVFGLLAGSAVSQRARTGLAWFGVPILCAFSLKRMHSGFDLVHELTFYASYHADWRNQLVHVVFVPLLIFTAMIFLAYVPPLSRATPLGLPLNWATLAALAWSAHHCKCDPLVGLFTSLVTFGSAIAATAIVQSELPPSPRAKPKSKGLPLARYGRAARWAGALHALSWYMQIHPGHAIFEGRKAAQPDSNPEPRPRPMPLPKPCAVPLPRLLPAPRPVPLAQAALLDALIQSFMDGPLFIWMEVWEI